MARHLTSAAALAAIGLFAASAVQAGDCKLKGKLTLPVAMEGRAAVVTTKINGQEARFEVDTGAFFSMLTPEAVKRLKVTPEVNPPIAIVGVGGKDSAQVVEAKEFDVGGVPLKHVDFIVGGRQFAPGTVGLLGDNVLTIGDVDYDFAHGVMRLLVFDGCFDFPLAYWANGAYGVIPIDAEVDDRPGQITGRVKINGHSVKALFDTGAGASLLTREAAERVGLKVDAADVKSAGLSHGIGRDVVEDRIVPVDSFAIDNEEIKNTRLRVGKFELGDVDMLLGMDFFLSHHVLVARSQNKLYFTYTGGPVFSTESAAAPAPTPREPSRYEMRVAAAEAGNADALGRRGEALMTDRDFAGALAAFDKAVALDPKTPKRYVDRAHARLASDHAAEALADYDQALALDPAFVPALMGRGSYHAWKGDLAKAEADFAAALKAAPQDGGLEQRIAEAYVVHGRWAEAIPHYDAWIAQHQKDEMLWVGLNGRCWARAMLGKDLDKALDDCNAALRKGPRNSEALDSRGLVHLRRGELREAIADYDAALRLQPKLPWSLYGRGLARKRLGQTAEGEADIQAATAIDPNLPQQAGRIGLGDSPAAPTPTLAAKPAA